jgi:uncharacterized protein (DUF58 family)
MFSAIKNNDNVGLFIVSQEIEKFVPARKGKKHSLALLSTLISHKPNYKKTNLSKSLLQIANIIKKRSVIFIISDFLDQDFHYSLNLLKRRNDVIAIKINDLREKEIPDVGYIQLEDAETEEQIIIDTSDSRFRQRYKDLIKNEEEILKKIFKKQKIDCIDLNTDENYGLALKRFFSSRKRRSK